MFNNTNIDKKTDLLNPANRSLSVLSGSSVVKGEINIENDMRIDGNVDGNIYSGGKVVIGLAGCVKGQITSKSVEVIGKIWGNVTVSDSVIFRASSYYEGDVITRNIEIEAGARFFGNCKMEDNEGKKDFPENNIIISV